MNLELIVLIVVLVVAVFILWERLRSRREKDSEKGGEKDMVLLEPDPLFVSADEVGPSSTGRFKVKQMLDSASRKDQPFQLDEEEDQADGDLTLPNPFDMKDLPE